MLIIFNSQNDNLQFAVNFYRSLHLTFTVIAFIHVSRQYFNPSKS